MRLRVELQSANVKNRTKISIHVWSEVSHIHELCKHKLYKYSKHGMLWNLFEHIGNGNFTLAHCYQECELSWTWQRSCCLVIAISHFGCIYFGCDGLYVHQSSISWCHDPVVCVSSCLLSNCIQFSHANSTWNTREMFTRKAEMT